MSFKVRAAMPADLAELVPLFDAYRVFYEQQRDPAAAEAFLAERFESRDSRIFLARRADDVALGFAQLFPSFSSVAMRPILVLNDLYVAKEGRRLGVGKALLGAAHEFAREASAVRVSLKTAADNHSAQPLYESVGYVRDEAFYYYDFSL